MKAKGPVIIDTLFFNGRTGDSDKQGINQEGNEGRVHLEFGVGDTNANCLSDFVMCQKYGSEFIKHAILSEKSSFFSGQETSSVRGVLHPQTQPLAPN